jgi:predicted nucleotide-binding protein
MNNLSTVMAKLAGVGKAINSVLSENVSSSRDEGHVRTRNTFPPELVNYYFMQAASYIDSLRFMLPGLYGDFRPMTIEPDMVMTDRALESVTLHYSRFKVEQLSRDINQIFELRANSELEQPKQSAQRRVFLTHGHSNDWLRVQPFIEKDVGLSTLELAQEPNQGRTLIEKLFDNAGRCDSAVIVMTGDDVANEDEARVRENVMHEIGFFQGRYGRSSVVLLHEEGVNIPTNLSGVAYIPFAKDNIEGGFHVLQRELKALYKL